MVKAALTGNIGMGKSTVLKLFEELGAATINADHVVSELLQNPQVIEKVKTILGPGVINPLSGTLDRPKIASIIFSDDARRKEYEAFIHPMVFEQIHRSLAGVSQEVAVVEVPLLFETGKQKEFDASITVYADVSIAIDRAEQSGMTRAEAAERMMVQMPIAEKVRQSTYTVDNNEGMDRTRSQVRQIYRALIASGGPEA